MVGRMEAFDGRYIAAAFHASAAALLM